MGNGAVAVAEEKKPTQQYCEYVSTKIDGDIYHNVRAVAAMLKLSTQEYISQVMNEDAARHLGQKPVKRKSPPPHPKRPKK